MKARLTSSILLALAAAVSAHAGDVAIDVSAFANAPWTVLTNGNTFPTGSQNMAGIPFLIPTGPNNWWSAQQAANNGPGTVSITVPVGLSGVTSAFTLLNTEGGQPGPQSYLFVTFNGTGGASFTKQLVGNVDVRDYNNDGWTNTINKTTTVQVFDDKLNQRLDRQEYLLPASFASQVLTSVTITDSGNIDFSRAVFSGLAVSTCQSYVPASIHVATGPIIKKGAAGQYTQRVDVSNVDQQKALTGPLFLVLEDFPSGVSLLNPSHPTTCWAPVGSPYVVVIPRGSTLAPQTTAVVHLEFNDPSGSAISYKPLAVASQVATP